MATAARKTRSGRTELSSPRKRGPIVPRTADSGIWIPASAGMTATDCRPILSLARTSAPEQLGDFADCHISNAHAFACQALVAIRPRGDDRGNVDDCVRARRWHAADTSKLGDRHEPIGHVLVEKAVIDAGRRLDPTV